MGNQKQQRQASPKRKRVLTSLLAIIIGSMSCLGVYGCSLFDAYRNDPASFFYEPWKSPRPSVPVDVEHPDLGDLEEVPTLNKEIEYKGKKYTYNNNMRSYTLLGVDTSVDRDENKFGYNCDTIMIAAVNIKTNHARIISIPRDTRTTVNRLDKDGKVIRQLVTKINAAYPNGGSNKALRYENTLDAVSDMFGDIPFTYYVGLNMDSIAPIVDAVGGVPIYVDEKFPAAFNLPVGQTVLNGEKAMIYVRERKNIGTGGDVPRTARQRKFVVSLAKQIKSKNPITLLPTLYNTMTKYYDSNMNATLILTLANILMQVDLDHMDMSVLPGSSKDLDGDNYWIYDKDKLMEWIIETYYIPVNE